MKRIIAFLGVVIFFTACVIPYIKISDDLSIKQSAWRRGAFYRIKTIIKNTSGRALNIRVVCTVGDRQSVYSFRMPVGAEKEIAEDVMKPLINVDAANYKYICKYHKFY